MIGIEAQHRAKMVLRLGQSVQCVQGDAEIVERFDVVRIDAEGLAFAFDSLRCPPLVQDGEAEISPEVGAFGCQGESGTVERLRLGATARFLQVDRDGVTQIGVDLGGRFAKGRPGWIADPCQHDLVRAIWRRRVRPGGSGIWCV